MAKNVHLQHESVPSSDHHGGLVNHGITMGDQNCFVTSDGSCKWHHYVLNQTKVVFRYTNLALTNAILSHAERTS